MKQERKQWITICNKNKVDFIDWFGDYDDWSCTIEEFTRALLGKKKFLEMPRDINSYLEIEINDL